MGWQKNCQSRREAIAALVIGELETDAAEELKKHIDMCEGCRSLYQALIDEEESIRSAFEAVAARTESMVDKLIERSGKPSYQSLLYEPRAWWGGLMTAKKLTKLAVAASIILAVSMFCWFSWKQGSSTGKDAFTGFGPLARACVAEDVIFAGRDVVHIKNEIVVYPIPKGLSEEVKEDFNEPNTSPVFAWLPMCSLQANGKFRFDQLKLPPHTEPYTVTDEAWYDPLTGRFARLLQTAGKVVFANSYDGRFVYISQVAANDTLQLVKEAITRKFRPPRKPAEFLGMGAGLRSSLGKDAPMVQGVSEGTLGDGCPAHIYKAGMAAPSSELKAYWLFRVRDDNGTIAEMEFVILGQTQLLVRRVLTESVKSPQISWSLSEIEGLPVVTGGEPRVSVTPDMVVSNVSVQHMVERASFETYVFSSKPSWTSSIEIIDCFDPPSLGKRMFIFACRADDGRHLVLIQSPSYNMTFGKVKERCRLVYSSPNGFKVWGGGPDKWYSNILLSSARATIKDPPAENRIGYVLESPAGTFPVLAVNGPVTDEELHALVDSFIPARQYPKE